MNDSIIGTDQLIEKDDQGRIVRVEHNLSDGTNFRVDTIKWSDLIIIEYRLLFNGEGVRIGTNANTLVTNIRTWSPGEA